MINPESPRGKQAFEVITFLDNMGQDYKVIDRNKNDIPVLIRVTGWGLIWPTTGTFTHYGKMCKANYKALYISLKNPIPEGKKHLHKRFYIMSICLSELVDSTDNQDLLKNFCHGILAKYSRSETPIDDG